MAESLARLNKTEIPQADVVELVIALVRHLASGRSPESLPGIGGPRNVEFYVTAAQVVGLIDDACGVTAIGRELAAADRAEAFARFTKAFEACRCGEAWLVWQGVKSVSELDPDRALEFLAARSELKPKTRVRRAGTLKRWIKTLCGRSAAAKPRRSGEQSQMHLGHHLRKPPREAPRIDWPKPTRFPHNEGGARVEQILATDLAVSNVLIVTGYASLDRVIDFLAGHAVPTTPTIRILFGAEPYPTNRTSFPLEGESLAEEIRKYWLGEGISVALCAAIIKVRELVESGRVLVRAAPAARPIHAKVYATPETITLGSSNFTDRGLVGQSEANARFEVARDPKRFQDATKLAEGLWMLGYDYKDAFLALLHELLRAVTWREAVARACATVLEGEWAKSYLPPDELAELRPPLWPHQLQGISQALWILENVGSVLVADATGSGKTRMGSWLLRAAFDRQYRTGHARRSNPVVIAPPQVIERWGAGLREAKLNWRTFSHGPLSNPRAAHHAVLVEVIGDAELLAVDEAHNFLNPSGRTRRLVAHYADHALLFTATPINRGAADLLAIVDLVGADNFSDDALDTLKRLERLRKRATSSATFRQEADRIRAEIRRFTVRRTRTELNSIAEERKSEYFLGKNKFARYPHHRARYYDVGAPDADLAIAREIRNLADKLTGVGRIGRVIELPRALAFEGMTEAQYLRRIITSAPALAAHLVMDTLRSSRAALYEHIYGTDKAWSRFQPPGGSQLPGKSPTGDTLAKLKAVAGSVPEWKMDSTVKETCPNWLWDPEAHRKACEADAALYAQIGELVGDMSDAREVAKRERLTKLAAEHKLVIAFDSHVITLVLFARYLTRDGDKAEALTGEKGIAAKKYAERVLGIGAGTHARSMIALCSDALSEGINLQNARCVVHLDTPTVIRTAEQRAGRVDRMDSPHDEVEIWWPRDPPAFAPTKRDLFLERHEMVTDLIGANLELPVTSDPFAVEELARKTNIEAADNSVDPSALFDAFRPIHELIGRDGLVEPKLYDQMRTSQADVIACVSAVASTTPWAFLAVGGLKRAAPRWVFFDTPDADPVADLAQVAAELRSRLAPDTADLELGDRPAALIQRFVERLSATERKLLPVRRQRALDLADDVLRAWHDDAWRNRDQDRSRVIRHILEMLAPSRSDPHPDPRTLADIWLRLVRPLQRRVLEERRGRRRLWKLDALRGPLLAEPIKTDTLRVAFADLPRIPPVSRRVVAMVIGAPGEETST